MVIPQLVAIILDGNGRWAKSKGMPRNYGHVRGAKNLEIICEDAWNMGIKYLTVYLFSTENWKRSADEVEALMKEQGVVPYILSTEACAVCERCAYLDGEPCRYPERMHPCVESHGINILPTLEELGIPFQYGENVVTWVSLLFFKDGK